MNKYSAFIYRFGKEESDDSSYLFLGQTELTGEQQGRIGVEFAYKYSNLTRTQQDKIQQVVRGFKGREKRLLIIIEEILGEKD